MQLTTRPTTSSTWRPAARLGAGLAALGLAAVGVPLGPSAPADAATRPACTAAMTRFAVRSTEGAAGSIYTTLAVTNTSAHACSIHGYGGISYVGHGNGTQIGAAADRTPATVRTVTLRPGRSAVVTVRMVEAGNYGRRHCRPTKVDGLRIYLPGETHSQYVGLRTVGCANPHVHLLSSKPYRTAKH